MSQVKEIRLMMQVVFELKCFVNWKTVLRHK